MILGNSFEPNPVLILLFDIPVVEVNLIIGVVAYMCQKLAFEMDK